MPIQPCSSPAGGLEFQKYLISPDGLAALGKFGSVVYERLGSWEMVAAVVTSLYKKLFSDPRTEPFFRNLDHSKVMAHFTGFLSCSLGNRMPLSPKQVWMIHRDMLWSPDRARQQQAPPQAAPQSSCCPLAGHGQASKSTGTLSGTCPFMTDDRPSVNSNNALMHQACPVAGQSQAGSMVPASWPGACPVVTNDPPSSGSDSTIVLKGCPVAQHSQAEGESGPPILRPDHVGILIEMLRDALMELSAQEELINETTNLLYSMSWVFERGDIFDDPRNEEKQWQDSHSTQGMVASNAYPDVDPWLLVAAAVENC